MKTASLLLRLSGKSTDDSTGLATQEADLRALAARHGATVVAVHVDDGLSGALRNRPGFLAWLDDGRTAKANHLLAWKLDRVSRGSLQGLAKFLDVVDGLNDAGERAHAPVRFLSFKDNLDSQAPGWDIQVAVLGALAKGERDAIRARILSHREMARSVGRAVGGRRAWVFRIAARDGGGSRLVPVPEHAEAIRWALEHLKAGGSVSAIPREWTRRKLKPKGDGSWHVTPVRRILSNVNLYGATTHHGDVIRNADGTARVDEEQAILTLESWIELQRWLAKRATARDTPDREEQALLAGLLHCGSCDRVMYAHRPEGRTWTYRCRGGMGCDQPVSVVMDAADEILTERFHQYIGDAPERPSGWELDIAPVDPAEMAALSEALSAAERRLAGDVGDDEALEAIRQRRELRERLAALQDAAATQPTELREHGASRTLNEAYDAAETTRERTRLIGMALPYVTVKPGVRGGPPGDVAERFEW